MIPDLDHVLPSLIALGQVIVIDLLLAGDNAIVVGMAAAGLPKQIRGKVILIGIMAATVMRIAFALVATQLLVIIGLTLAGGILLLWVCWKFWRELSHERRDRLMAAKLRREAIARGERPGLAAHDDLISAGSSTKTMRQAILQIVLADLSMSLDNVLAVAGAAAQHMWVLVIGLLLSVGLMGAAAGLIAGLLKRYHWFAYVGLAIILWVAVSMIYRGSNEVMDQMGDARAKPATATATA